MPYYTTDRHGNITAISPTADHMPNTHYTYEDIIYGYDGKLYKKSQVPEPPKPTLEEKAALMHKNITDAIQLHLDNFARTRGYDGILSAATYVMSNIPKFQSEGQYAVEARDAIWIKAYSILDEFLSGKRLIPEELTSEFIEGLIAELPVLKWPVE